MGGYSSTFRSSPVSSCCGSSQGRSSPDVEPDLDGDGMKLPPQFPLGPGQILTFVHQITIITYLL